MRSLVPGAFSHGPQPTGFPVLIQVVFHLLEIPRFGVPLANKRSASSTARPQGEHPLLSAFHTLPHMGAAGHIGLDLQSAGRRLSLPVGESVCGTGPPRTGSSHGLVQFLGDRNAPPILITSVASTPPATAGPWWTIILMTSPCGGMGRCGSSVEGSVATWTCSAVPCASPDMVRCPRSSSYKTL